MLLPIDIDAGNLKHHKVLPKKGEDIMWQQLEPEIVSLYEQHRFAEAADLARQVLTELIELYGGDNHQVFLCLTHLVDIYLAMENYVAAEFYMVRVIELSKRFLPPDHPEMWLPYNKLAVIYKKQEKWTEAETMFRRALGVMKPVEAHDFLQIGENLANLGDIYKMLGELDQAEKCTVGALKIAVELLGPDHIDVLTTVHQLAVINFKQGKYKEAEVNFQQAKDGYVRLSDKGYQ